MAICHPFMLHQERLNRNRRTGNGRISRQTSSANLNSTKPISNQADRSMSLKKRTCAYILPVLIISIIINIPKFMEFRTISK